MKNKIIILLISVILFKSITDLNDIKYQNKIIDKIYDNHIEESEFKSYIEIPKYKIKRLIKEGVTNDILDKNYVGIMNIDNDNLTVLAGHNINLVFHKIHHLSKNDVVYIKSYKKVKEYKVIKKTIVNIDNYDLLFKKYNKDTLILITCTNNDLKRLIVICELVKIG